MTKNINKPLDDLFVRLRTATNAEDAQQLEDSIWEIWFHYDGDNRHINYLMGRVASAMANQHFEQAEVLCSTVIELAPEFVEGLNRRATVRYLAADIDGSIADISAVLDLEPRHFGALSGLGLCFLALEDLEKAADTIRRVLAIHPNAAGAKNNLAEIEEALGHRGE
jgi:tetratricopeptide (TPR) repeat protein